MGTRCLTVVNDEIGREIGVLYRQMDGYPEGHGEELRKFVGSRIIVNGLSGGPWNEDNGVANGMGCLFAQIVAHFKTEAGMFYLYPPGTRDYGEEYIYTVSFDKLGKPAKVKQE